ncbi:single-stranded-DNA-specific exonuclease RecJ [Methanospirillum lacunae]|uniref:Phosphoesterase n=1 Tax=Methanospirillum lacunae TaxID=668570 RepID=A0A2V2N3B8_9EURY|nr:DHH family phosphoesterase [Methanospirillum lacunae]PWR72206.1 phosphoesterase [Methanospirillum lacunae]
MSIDTAAKDLASHITRQDQVEIRCHHDADGIAAGAIMSIALFRSHIPFRLRVVPRIQSQDIPKGGNILLCDLGSGIPDLPEETMVIDHHIPLFEGPYHVNPRLNGIDGDTELSGAGAAYLVANAIGDNRDLAGLVLSGIIGDGQRLAGKNHEIYLEGMGNGIVSKKRGIRLAGRDLTEQLTLATNPYLPGISGSESETTALINQCSDGSELSTDILLSLLMLDAAERSRPEALLNLYGDVYQLEREVISDAHSLTMLIDACGKEDQGSIAAAISLRNSSDLPAAWDIARNHRLRLIDELNKTLGTSREAEQVYEISDKRLASDVADALNFMDGEQAVIVVVNQDDGTSHLSIRVPARQGTDLGTLVHSLAADCSGHGGGHTSRAGATISSEHLSRFITAIHEVYA